MFLGQRRDCCCRRHSRASILWEHQAAKLNYDFSSPHWEVSGGRRPRISSAVLEDCPDRKEDKWAPRDMTRILQSNDSWTGSTHDIALDTVGSRKGQRALTAVYLGQKSSEVSS